MLAGSCSPTHPICSTSSLPQLPTFSCMSLILSILDDVEVFEKQKAFELEELMTISDFFNHLIYETVLLMSERKSTPRALMLACRHF
ncbi:unnamed protein product [Dibothriocephalus latus]|uniref:Uncharacterized protein n=1 Tax=Dibothriocephalus latus TaxID=60516 RepID=A0A3P7M1U1_DIBLA|nr:unnamed protein product [Dibothriocephalus latus]